jgi:hypothetical protein
MSGVVVTLGGVSFQDMEVPETISFGGRQRLSVQPLIGGGRVVQTLGIDDGVISFSGIFSGPDAGSRAQLLDAARALGAVLPLVWDGFFYNVVIREFVAEYRKTNLIPFVIVCTVVADPLADAAAVTAPLAAIVEQDVSAASALGGQAGVTLDAAAAASVTGLTAVRDVVTANVTSAGIATLAAGAALQTASDPAAGASALGALNAASSQLAALSAMSGFVARAATNLAIELV